VDKKSPLRRYEGILITQSAAVVSSQYQQPVPSRQYQSPVPVNSQQPGSQWRAAAAVSGQAEAAHSPIFKTNSQNNILD